MARTRGSRASSTRARSRPARTRGRRLVARPDAHGQPEVERRLRRQEVGVGLRRRPGELVAAAAYPLVASAARGDDRLLVQPPPCPRRPRHRLVPGATTTTRCSAASALGKFDDLLVAASLHPSMLLYLSNFESTRTRPNENQGRELLELHTVGRASGYTEDMVKDSAQILTGYTVAAWEDLGAVLRPGAARDRSGQGARFRAREPQGRRPQGDARPISATSRTTRPPHGHRHASWRCGSCPTTPSAGLVNTPRAASSGPRHQHQGHLAGTGGAPGVRRVAPTEGAQPDRGLHRHRPRPRRRGANADASMAGQFAEAQIWMCKGQYPFMWPRPDGMPQTQRRVVVGEPGARSRSTCTTRCPAAGSGRRAP